MALRLIGFCLFGMAVLGPTQAESLPDPTRPALGATASSPGETSGPSASGGPQLQAIRSQAGVRSAMIDGQSVRIGAKVGDAVVTRIDEDRVWLRGSGGVRELKLFPEVEKRSVATQQKDIGSGTKPFTKTPVGTPASKRLWKETK